MTTLRVLLVDDEPLAIEGLALRLERIGGVEIVGRCRNGREAIRTIREAAPDLVLLDIEMPGLGGLDVVRSFLGDPAIPLFVFVTAFDRYAVAAFETHAVDYLLKPVETSRLEMALRTARERLTQRAAAAQNVRLRDLLESLTGQSLALGEEERLAGEESWPSRLEIRDRGRTLLVEVAAIDHIEAAGDYLCIHAEGETHIMRETMKAMERRLDPMRFRRVHRSAIVNLDRIAELVPHSNGESFLTLKNGVRLKVSRSCKSAVAQFLR